MRILIACEESQEVVKQFRYLGHEAFSCDILECSGGYPEWHIQTDVMKIINKNWDLMIAFPPCTHLAVSGARHFIYKKKDGRQKNAITFFMQLISAPINKIAIENPVGIMSSIYRKPDQIIQPYYFGDPFQKKTCLWLKNLPKLFHQKQIDLFSDEITHTNKGEFFSWICKKTGKEKKQPLWLYKAFANGKVRSKTFPGIAKSMAEQWSKI